MKHSYWKISALVAIAIAVCLQTGLLKAHTAPGRMKQESRATNANGTAWKAPDPSTIPQGPVGDSIRLGLQIFRNTPQYAAEYVGNQLSCSDCHLKDGTAPYSSPLVGVPGLFPMYNARAGRVITFEDRVQECFVRSENGQPLPYRSPKLVALIAYIQWLLQSQPAGKPFPTRGLVKLPALRGDPVNGAKIYAKQCEVCHQANGGGIAKSFPPLWGPASFNDGAGMSHVAKMAAFVQYNMPQTKPGSLTAQEAYDVSAYIDSKPRPRYDARYDVY